MNRLFKIAELFRHKLAKVDLKNYREKEDSATVEKLIENALSKHEGHNVDVSYHGQHYGLH
jgi:hypothetical protein